MHQAANLLRQTFRIRAVQCLHAVFIVNYGRVAADRTDRRNLDLIAAGQILGNLRYDHIGFVYADCIADSQLQFPHDTDIMHRCPADRRAFKLNRIKDRHRVDESGTRSAPFNFP